MTKRITIDPVTRLEGHGKIEIFLDESGNVAKAYVQVPELRGFEKFSEGRDGRGDAEDHAEDLRRVPDDPPHGLDEGRGRSLQGRPAASREAHPGVHVHSAFMFEDHTLHFYFLGGPDFVVGPDAPAAKRNVLGVIAKVGIEIGERGHQACAKRPERSPRSSGAESIHPGLRAPGRRLQGPEQGREPRRSSPWRRDAVEFARFTLNVRGHRPQEQGIRRPHRGRRCYQLHRTYYMGLVDKKNKVNFYDG